ncbi:hypothetical protein EJ02DRAFT_300787, partial [Clathrospora elynae]
LAHSFSPIVNGELIQQRWLDENPDPEAPYPDSWDKTMKRDHWSAKSPRRVVPINIEPSQPLPILSDTQFGRDESAVLFRERRPSAKYSDALN